MKSKKKETIVSSCTSCHKRMYKSSKRKLCKICNKFVHRMCFNNQEKRCKLCDNLEVNVLSLLVNNNNSTTNYFDQYNILYDDEKKKDYSDIIGKIPPSSPPAHEDISPEKESEILQDIEVAMTLDDLLEKNQEIIYPKKISDGYWYIVNEYKTIHTVQFVPGIIYIYKGDKCKKATIHQFIEELKGHHSNLFTSTELAEIKQYKDHIFYLQV